MPLDDISQHPHPGAKWVVGIGASAGGLEAVSSLLAHIRLDDTAYVIVQHLSPDHDSVLAELLSRSSTIDVVTATDGLQLAANRVYVVPPNADLYVKEGMLKLVPQSARHRLSIDLFFRSLADDFGARSLGVVLSGTGRDGTFGLQAIKEAGGITFAQTPSTARYDGMPQSALSSGHADYVLDPPAIAREIAWITSREGLPLASPATSADFGEQLGRLFVLIRAEFGNDLAQYKPTTVQRRVERRMALQKLTRIEDYVRLVEGSSAELRALYQDMLISVTRFFRDRQPFAELKAQVLPRVVANKRPGSTLRAWVPACATGEEVYSLAMCIFEFLDERNLELQVQLFGTDVDEDAIDFARKGVYPRNIALDVSPERLARFFIEGGESYRIATRIRDAIAFSRHNLYRDPPFSRVDVASCRNLLIYLQPSAQKRVLKVLHHALLPDGFLMLGTSETVGDLTELFSVVDRDNKLYQKKPVAGFGALDVGFHERITGPALRAAHRTVTNLQVVADRKVLEVYGPAGLVIDEKLRVLHYRGRMGPYLEPAAGTASLELVRVLRPELRADVKRLAQKAVDSGQRVEGDVRWSTHEERNVTGIDVLPLAETHGQGRCLVVLFHPRPVEPVVLADHAAPVDEHIAALERELAASRDALQAALDERAEAEEEFKFATEELQSTNEELQSTNEELETSKEELQSTNEELVTVNDELHSRMKELGQINDDLHNVLLGVDQPVVIAGMDLRIRRFTLAAEKLFNLVPGDVGRSIEFLERFVGPCKLSERVNEVIRTLAVVQEDLLASNQRWYQLRITPYKTVEHSIRGAVVTLVDIDLKKRASDLSALVEAYAARFLAGVDHPLVLVDRRLRVTWANPHFFKMFQVAREELLGTPLADLGSRSWLDGPLHDRLTSTLEKGTAFRDVSVLGLLPDGSRRSVRFGASSVQVATDAPMALVSFEVT